jgi:hypothetical protein
VSQNYNHELIGSEFTERQIISCPQHLVPDYVKAETFHTDKLVVYVTDQFFNGTCYKKDMSRKPLDYYNR